MEEIGENRIKTTGDINELVKIATKANKEHRENYEKYSELISGLEDKMKEIIDKENHIMNDLARVRQYNLLITYYKEHCIELMHAIYVMNAICGDFQENEQVKVYWNNINKINNVILIKQVSDNEKVKIVWFLRKDKTIFKRVDIDFQKHPVNYVWNKSKESTKTWFQFPEVGIQYELYKYFNIPSKDELWTLFDNKLGTGIDGNPVYRTIYNCHVMNGIQTWFDDGWNILECTCKSAKFDKDGIQQICSDCQTPCKYLSTK
jgi:sporulation protein YlmC with PRC-barrel domain